MKKIILYFCAVLSFYTSFSANTENINIATEDFEISSSEREITQALLKQFFTLIVGYDLAYPDELVTIEEHINDIDSTDDTRLCEALEKAEKILEPLIADDEQAATLHQQLQQRRELNKQTRAAVVGMQIFDKLTVYNQLVTYGPVSINGAQSGTRPTLSVTGGTAIDDLTVGTANIQNISLGNIYGVTPSSPTQYVIINPDGTLGSTPGNGGSGTVNSVSGGNGVTITGDPTVNPTVNLIVPVSIANGGTNATSMTNTDGVVYYDGTKLNTTSAGVVNYVLTGNGPSAAPTFQPLSAIGAVTSVSAGQGINITGTAGNPIVNINAPLSPSLGGTGLSVITPHTIVVGEGSAPVNAVGPGNAGQLLVSGGASADPAFVTPTAGSGLSLTTNASTLQYQLSIPVSIASGGTNATSMTDTDGVVYYDGTKLNTTSVGTATYVLTSNGAGNAPSFQPVSGSGAVTSVIGGNGINITGTSTAPIVNLTAPVSIANGGTNATSFSSPYGIVYYNGTQLVTADTGPASSVLASNGEGNPPSSVSFSSSNVPNALVVRDGSGNFASNIITGNMLNANPTSGNAITVNGTNFIIDYQGNINTNGNITLNNASALFQLPAGSTSAPSLTFTGSTTTGLSASSGNLSLSTNGSEAMKISSAGTISIDQFTTTGVVHNDSSGNLSTSLIVNADISSSAGITDSKLATISTPGKVANSATTATSSNTPSTIVARDSSGNFSAGTITATLTGSASLDVLKAGDTMTGTLTLPAGSSTVPSLQFSGSANTGISAPATNTLSFDVNGTEAININSSGQVRIDNLSPAGVVHNSATGLLSTSLIVDADITTGTISNDKLANISSSDTPGDIVVRDGSGNFETNMITIDGTPSANTDVATVAYVNSVAGSGIVIHEPALVVAPTQNYSPYGPQTIDGVVLSSGNRVLLDDQTNVVENGLWVAAVGAGSPWYRPTDFATGSPAGNAYVLITEGTNYGGSSWLCSTPTAIIGTDPIFFQEFSLPNQVNGANVGSGTGLIYQSKSGTTLNFRSLAAGQYMSVTTSPTAVTIATNATPSDTPSTIVARDGSGNFAAGIITAQGITVNGDASVSGTSTLHNTNLTLQSEIDLHDLNTGNYVGLKAPATVNSNYTLLFPASPPTANQILQAGSITPTQLAWVATPGNTSPSISRTIYVTEYGNDTTGDGSFAYPYASLAKAVEIANPMASAANPVIISIAPGIYIENNSAGPITVTAGGISIVGQSANATFIVPNTLSNDLLAINPSTPETEIRLNELTFDSGGVSTASAISLGGIGNSSLLTFLQIFGFNTGIFFGGTDGSYLLTSAAFEGNTTAITIDNVEAVCNNCIIVGSSPTGTPANTGVSITGSSANIIFSSGLIYNCSTGATVSNDAEVSFDQCTFRNNTNAVIQNSSATVQFMSCGFQTNPGISIQASGSGTSTGILGCYFNGLNVSGSPQGTAIQTTGQANVNIAASEVLDYITGIEVGSPTDTASTSFFASANTEINNLTLDIVQNGSSTLVFNGTANSNKISINDSTNVELNYFNLADNTLTIGKLNDTATPLITVAAFPSNNPQLVYNPSIYATQAMGYQDKQASPTSLFVLSGSDTNFTAITTDRTKIAGLRLVSDTSLTVGGPNSVGIRGWDVNKNASTAQLSFSYQNSDSGDGQNIIPEYTLMQLDGVNNQLQLPTTSLTSPTEIVFGGDTNLYRNAVNSLKTDDNFVIGGSLTVNTLPAHAVLIGEGSGTPIASAGPGSAGQLLIAGGAFADPKFVTPTAGNGLSVSSSPSQLSYSLTAPVSIANGGTGVTNFSSPDGVLYYNGTNLATTNAGTANYVLTSNGSGNAPTFKPISGLGAITTINGNSGSISGSTVTIEGGNNITTSGAGSTLTVNVTGTTANAVQVGSPSGALHSIPVGTNGQVLLGASGGAPAFATLTSTGNTLAYTTGANALNIDIKPPVSVSYGGTGATTLTPFNILAGNGTAAIAMIAPTSTTGIPLISNGLTSNPSFGTASVAGGGTGATSFTANSVILSGATSTSALTSQALTNGQLLIGSTGNAPVASTLTAGTGIAITNNPGSITITNSGSSGITTLTGDTGSATGSTVTFNANSNAGSTVKFSGSGSTMNLLVTSPSLHNTLIGLGAGNSSLTGTNNTALGYQALNALTTGTNNIDIGYQAGSGVTTGTNNIHIGTNIPGANESNTIRIGTQGTQTACYLAGVYGIAHGGGSVPVQITSDGKITGQTSSRRYKENITPLISVSGQLAQLEPVTFTYKIDNGKYPQYGLIAEDVYTVYPEWIIYNKEKEIDSVNYAFLPPTLLKGWQEQQHEIVALHTIVNDQQEKLEKLFEKCISLESRLEAILAIN